MDDKTIHIVKLRSVSVALMVELTMKDSYQVVYQGKEKTSFHAKNLTGASFGGGGGSRGQGGGGGGGSSK